MTNPVAMLGKALKMKKLWQSIPEPVKIHEEIVSQVDGSAIYVFQAKFPSKEAAEMFRELSALSAEMEKAMQS